MLYRPRFPLELNLLGHLDFIDIPQSSQILNEQLVEHPYMYTSRKKAAVTSHPQHFNTYFATDLATEKDEGRSTSLCFCCLCLCSVLGVTAVVSTRLDLPDRSILIELQLAR